jgi:hypothetical protein
MPNAFSRRAAPAASSVAAVMLAATSLWSAAPALAASSEGCENGGFIVNGTPKTTTSLPATSLGPSFKVDGLYVEFDVVSATFEVDNYVFTGVANPRDITGGVRSGVFASKKPDHRGLTLTSAVTIENSGPDLVITRTGPGLTMKLQAKDCANGGLFQMEIERGDGTATTVTHNLWTDPSNPKLTAFYFDNPNFRAREGDFVPYKDTTVQVTPRINWANDFSRKFVGRDSPQVATRVTPPAGQCVNQIRKRDGTFATVNHCGGQSVWSVASGGRMGQVMGEDATEVAPPATACTHQCQAQNRVRGQATNLGFPFPVPDASRLKPRFPA